MGDLPRAVVTAERPVFVVGCPRSGTTLLSLMLHAHPRLAIPPETRHLIDVYDRRTEFGDLRDPAAVQALVDVIVGERRFADLGVDEGEVRRVALEVAPTVGAIAAVLPALYAARWDKPRWGDKRPGYFRRIDAILAMYPDAQLVHLIRDGRDCVASLKRMTWWASGTIGAIQTWVDAMRFGDRARRRLRPDQYFELRYEDLVRDPGPELERLCDYLGERFDPRMLRPGEVAVEAVPERKRERHHRRTTEQVTPEAVGRHASGLEPWERRLFEAVAARWLRRHGYPLTTGRRPLPGAWPLVRYVPWRARVLLGRLRAGLQRRWAARRDRYPVARPPGGGVPDAGASPSDRARR